MASINFRALLLQLFLYSLVGSVACCVDLAIFYFLLQMETLSHLVITSISFTLATFANYALCYRFVFSSTRNSVHNQILKVFFIALIGLFLNGLGFYLFKKYTSIAPFPIKLAVIPLVMLWNFSARRVFVYSAEMPLKTLAAVNRLRDRL